ncbi:MAG TPA: SDR family NAD(P)-dependent oxidoreductase [Pseudolabrys sp.]|jgi:NAD(P)-dependent dehydrogenase (short-subunit alcohol dehydrogenase family)|nr:SDR family NAD(P)-dependent oxidoreductase [Pseudolabrys sp.]
MANTKKIAAVTGGAQGLGRAIAERLGQSGIAVVLGDINLDMAKKTAEEMKGTGIDATALQLNVVDEKSVAGFYAEIDKRFGRLDILVNNAGVLGLDQGKRPLVEEMSLELWRQTIDVNLTGVFLASRGAIPLMKRGKWGRIVSISSRAARMKTGMGNSNYAASKAGVIGFSRVMAGELGRDGITVNCIAPSRIPTAMTLASPTSKEAFERNIAETAVGRLATPQDVASTINYLCTDDASFLTGLVIDVTGGSFMP